MASGGRKPGEGTEELGTDEADTEQGRGGQENIGKFFQGGSSTGAAVWGGDVGVDSKNREGVVLVHAWGRETYHGDTAVERGGAGNGITPPWRGPLRKRDLRKSGH